MAGLTASGIGSGLDIQGLVQQLVAAERAPHALRLNRAEAGAKAKLSAFGSLSSAFDALKKALDPLRNQDAFGARTAKSSAEDSFTVSAARNAPLGSYEVEVLSLASAHKLVSGALDEAAGLGAGTLQIEVGDKTFEVEIVAGKDTPAEIRDAVNAAAKAVDAKLGATLVRSDDGVHLSLTATDTGAAHRIRVTRLQGDTALDALVYDPGTLTSLTERNPAADAQVRIDGLLRSAAGNRIVDAVPGLTLDLKKAEPGAIRTFTVSADAGAVRGAVQAFVNAYNAAVNAMANATRYNAETREPSALTGDALIRSAGSQLRNALSEALGAAAELGLVAARLGLSTRVDGTLAFDGGKFDTALASDGARLREVFGGEGGLAARLADVVDRFIGRDGAFAGRSASLNKQLRSVADQREALDRRLESARARYLAQFTAMDTLIAQLNSTSQFLAQRLAPPRQEP